MTKTAKKKPLAFEVDSATNKDGTKDTLDLIATENSTKKVVAYLTKNLPKHFAPANAEVLFRNIGLAIAASCDNEVVQCTAAGNKVEAAAEAAPYSLAADLLVIAFQNHKDGDHRAALRTFQSACQTEDVETLMDGLSEMNKASPEAIEAVKAMAADGTENEDDEDEDEDESDDSDESDDASEALDEVVGEIENEEAEALDADDSSADADEELDDDEDDDDAFGADTVMEADLDEDEEGSEDADRDENVDSADDENEDEDDDEDESTPMGKCSSKKPVTANVHNIAQASVRRKVALMANLLSLDGTDASNKEAAMFKKKAVSGKR